MAFDAGNPTTVNESGTAERVYSYTIFDPGDDTVDSVDVSCGSGTLVTTGPNAPTNTDTTGSFACIFDDGPDDTSVSAAATDDDGDTGATATQAVTSTTWRPRSPSSAATTRPSMSRARPSTSTATRSSIRAMTRSTRSISCDSGTR